MSRGVGFSPAVALPESRIPEEPRRELRRGTTGVDFELGGVSIRVGDVPLHRRGDDGRLLQCLRLVLRSDQERGPARITVSAGEVVEEANVHIVRGENIVRLFVPEAHEPTTLRLRVEGPGGLRLEQALEARPQRKWRIFLIHHSHLDLGYTDLQAQVLAHHLSYLDSVLDLAGATDGWPDPARFRWNIEANWPLQRWLAARPGAARERLFELVSQRRIEVTALPFTMHLEASSVDELARQLQFADELRDRHDVAIVTAMQTDVPGAPGGLPGLLADAGVRYLDVAHNWAGRGTPYLNGGEQLSRPFRWRSESGKRVLVWYTDSPHGVAYLEGNLLGLADSYDVCLELLPEYLAALATRPYPYGRSSEALGLPTDVQLSREPYAHDILHLRVQGALADNAGPSLVPAEIVRAWNERWAFPELRLATNREFFEEVEERLGDRLETFAGDWTDWWADGIGSAARALGLNRRAQAIVRTAQSLHVLSDQLEGERTAGWTVEADHAFTSMALFDEHTWGAAHPSGDDLGGRESGALQWQTKAALASDACSRSEAMLESAASRLAGLAGRPTTAVATIVAFNPSSWPRSDVVRTFVPASRMATERPFALRDSSSGEQVASVAELQAGSSERNRPRGTFVSFMAHDVPALGYRCFELVEVSEPEPPVSAPEPLVLENEHYVVEVDPAVGCAVRLVDKELSLDVVDAGAPFGFNQYVYDRYTSLLHATQRLPARGGPAANGPVGLAPTGGLVGSRTTARHGVVAERSSNAVEDRIALRLVADGVEWLETSFRLVRGLRRLDVVNRLAKVATREKEGLYFAFPFALAEPRVSYELTGAVGSLEEYVPGSALHVRAVRHWVALQDKAATVVWAPREAPLVELGGIFLPYPPFPPTAETNPATVVSWAMNNVWDTNFPVEQGGEVELAYAISSALPDANARALGVRVGGAVARPLVGVLAAASAAGLSTAGSFCSVDRPDVEVVTLMPSRRDHDFVALLQSYANEECEVRVAFPDLPVRRVWAGTVLERDLRDVTGDGEARVRIGPGDCLALAVDIRA